MSSGRVLGRVFDTGPPSVRAGAYRAGGRRSPQRSASDLAAADLVGRPDRRPRRTAPAPGATTTCSIFIASRVTSGSPASTARPTVDVDREDAPGIGAATSPITPPWWVGRPQRPARRPAAARAGTATLRPADVDVGGPVRRQHGRRQSGTASSASTTSTVRSVPPSVARRILRRVEPPPAGPRDRGVSAGSRGARAAAAQAFGRRLGRRRPAVRRPDPVERVDRAPPGEDDRLADEPAQEPQVRRQPEDDRLVERRSRAGRAPRPGRGHRRRSSPASGRTGRRPSSRGSIPASTRIRPSASTGQWRASTRPVAGRNPASASSAYSRTSTAWPPRVSDRVDLRLVEPERLAGGDPELVGDEVATGHDLGHRVLDLEARVHLEEEERGRDRRAGTRTVPALT